MDDARRKQLDAGANMKTGGVNFDYVDTAKLERLGITKYNTKKPKGNNFIRIIAPDTVGAFAKEIHQHTQIGSSKATYLCLKEMWGEECPICNHQGELRRQNVSGDAIKELNASKRFLLYVVDTTDENSEDEGTHWFDCPVSIYKAICTLSQDRRTGEKIDPTDPVDGRDIEFVRKDGKRTEYTGFVLTKTPPIPKSWYSDLPAFEEILLKPDPEEMTIAVSGIKSESAASNSDAKSEAKPATSRRSRREPAETTQESAKTTQEPVEEPAQESRRERSEAKEEAADSEQAAAIKEKIASVQNRRRARE